MNGKTKVKIPPNSKILADFNNLSETKRKEFVEVMFELTSKDVTESKNLGFVTFADILGWKGIWRDKDRKPLSEILKIKKDLEEFIQKTYKEHLIQCFQLVTGEKLVEKNMADSVSKLKEGIIEEFYVLNKSRIESEQFFSTFEIDFTLDLISDTFVITSRPKSIKYHMEIVDEALAFHLKIARQLVIECLKTKLLIRGATSYGEFQKQESVFIGPAIDESASWHEQGEEIGIFLTPSAYMNFLDFRKKGLVELRSPKLKKNTFETLFINWREEANRFKSICKNESPLIPEIAPKYLNTLTYLESEINE